MLDVGKIKADFPILAKRIGETPLTYLDNSATSQKPLSVLEAVGNYYKTSNANVHRGSHTLADEATSRYESSRETVARFIGAPKSEEIVFTRNATEGINLVAYSYATKTLLADDEILLGIWEHHSNLVPWQEVALKTGSRLVYMKPTRDGLFDFTDFKSKVNHRTKIIAVAQASNVLGTIFPITDICETARKFGSIVVVDGAQSVPHMPVNVQKLGCDFLAFSGHKMLSPMGIGVLWGKKEIFDKMSPFMTGGGMISQVDENTATWEKLPYKFEAGTPNVGGAVGLASAVDYLNVLGMENVRAHEVEINTYALESFKKLKVNIPSLEVLGPLNPQSRAGLVTFYFKDIHAHDVSAVLDRHGVAVRSGFHCAMPLHDCMSMGPSVRASWYVYNSTDDIDALMEGLLDVSKILL